ncbi:MAG: type II secretion system F family protein [Phycisphaerae bacterium]|nr:type II secretion system F family protein [Phycisphaerae bacterium]
MPSFSYVARDAAGNRVKGTIDASNENAVVADLSSRGLAPVKVDVAARRVKRSKRITVRHLSRAYQQLSDLLRAGVPLLKALQLLGRSKSNPRLAEVLAGIAEEIAHGERLADAMARHPKVFPPVQVAMVRAGERGGFLDEVLGRLATMLVHQADLRARISGNLVYPIVLLTLAGGIVLAALVFFVPRFKEFFKKIELPLATKILFGTSDILIAWWPALLLLVVAAVGVILWGRRDERVRRKIADTVIRIPVVGALIRTAAAARVTRTLGTLLENGIPMLGAMQISRDAAGHPALADAIDHSVDAVRAGESLARPLGASGFLDEDIVEMISVGESANNLPQVLLSAADSLEKRIDQTLAMLLRLMEPAMLLILGCIVFFIFLALIVPMMRLSSAL